MVELVAKRYGTALYELAVENNQVEKLEEEVKTVKSIFISEKELLEVLDHPQVNIKDKQKLIEDIFSEKVSKEILGLIDLTIRKNRQNELINIFEYFLEKTNEDKGILIAHITSVEKLNEEEINKLTTRLEELTKKKIEIKQIIDPSIIGGLVIRIKDRIVDYSIKGRLDALSKDLKIHLNETV